MKDDLKDVVIIGSGISGLMASVYIGRAGFNPVVFTGDYLGGLTATASMIENFPGFPDGINGFDLMSRMLTQAENSGADILDETVSYIDMDKQSYIIHYSDKVMRSKAVVLATGSVPRSLDLPEAEKYEGKGIHYCAACDGNFYKGKDVVIVGGGESAMQTALYLSGICKSVTVLVRSKVRACKAITNRINAVSNIKMIIGCTLSRIEGNGYVERVVCNDGTVLNTSAIFVAMGYITAMPEISLAVPLKRDFNGILYVDMGKGCFACGDCVNGVKKQAVIAAGNGAATGLQVITYLQHSC